MAKHILIDENEEIIKEFTDVQELQDDFSDFLGEAISIPDSSNKYENLYKIVKELGRIYYPDNKEYKYTIYWAVSLLQKLSLEKNELPVYIKKYAFSAVEEYKEAALKVKYNG